MRRWKGYLRKITSQLILGRRLRGGDGEKLEKLGGELEDKEGQNKEKEDVRKEES